MTRVDNFYIFTSLRYDPSLQQVPSRGLDHAGWNYTHVSPFYCLDYHRERLLRAATHWGWRAAVDALSGEQGLTMLESSATKFLGSSQMSPVRLRIIVHSHGTVEFQKFDTTDATIENLFPSSLPAPGTTPTGNEARREVVYALVVDEHLTSRSEFTHYKTSQRDMYDAARDRAGIAAGDRKEVLMVNADDKAIMEGSITTPYFWRNGRWVTPPVSAKVSPSEGSGGNDGTSRRYALEHKLAVEEPLSTNSLVDGEDCWISNGVSGFIAAKLQLKK